MRRFLNKLVRDFRKTSTARGARRAPRRAPLGVEGLEDRLVLSTAVPPGLVPPQPLPAIQGVEGHALGASGKSQVEVAFFNSISQSAANFTATIHWGDGTTSQGTVVQEPLTIVPLPGALPPGGGIATRPGGFEVLGTHTYKHFGEFPIDTTVTARTGGQTVMVNQAHIQDAPLLALAPSQPLQAVAGVRMLQTQVAAFADTNPFGVAATDSAAINWGDGTTSIGLVKPATGIIPLVGQSSPFIVVGSHTYVQAGPFTVTTTVQDATNPAFGQPLVIQEAINVRHHLLTVTDQPLTFRPQALTVKDKPLTAVPVAGFNLVEGNIIPLGQVVGSFKDGDPRARASDYGPAGQSAGPGLAAGTALVDFGDGTTGIGQVVADARHPGVFDVLTPVSSLWHDYVAGNYHLEVTVSDRGGSQVVTDTRVHVADSPLALQSTTPVSTFTQQPTLMATLGTFVDNSGSLIQGGDTVSINWGDGTTSTDGQVVYDGNTTYSVTGNHIYSTASGKTPFTVHVVVKDPGGQSLTFNTQATVQNANTQLSGFVTNELSALQASIDQQLFGKTLPLVGTALDQLGDSIVGSFKQALIDGAQAAIGGNMQALQNAITKDLGSILQGITTTSDGSGGFTAEVHLHDSSVLSSGTDKVDLNLGLPGLPFQIAANNLAVGVQAGYDIVLDFGMHGGSPFLKTKADPSNTANPLGVALSVNAQIEPGSTISATLGVAGGVGLTATLTQPTAPQSTFNATLGFGFSVDTQGGIQLATPQLSGAANVNLEASVTLGDSTTLPSLSAGLNVNWTFNSADPTQGGLLGNTPSVSFNNVTVDLGSFLSNVVGPVVSAVQTFTQPMERLAEVLTAPLPGISDVTKFLGQPAVTLAELLDGSTGGGLTTFANMIEFINHLQVPASGSITVDVGSFNLTDARQANSQATNLVENAAVQQNGLLNASGAGQTQSTYSNLQFQDSFDFPMLDNPLGFVSSVLLGQQVDLVKANLGVNLGAGINVDIPIVGVPHLASLDVLFSGALNIDLGATFVLTDGVLQGGHLLDSLQVQNAHLNASLKVGAGASAEVLGFGASLDGTVSVNFDMGLTNQATGSTTLTGSDLLHGNVNLGVTSSQLQAAAELDAVTPLGSVTLFSFPLFTEDLLTGATTQEGHGGGGGGPPPNPSGPHHQMQ